MRAALITTGLVCSSLSLGCEEHAPPAQTAPSASTTSSAAVEFPPLPTAQPKPEGPRRWADFPGKPVEIELSGPRQWAAVPVSRQWDSLKIALLPYDGRKGDEHAFEGETLFVPGAFVHAATKPEKLAAGTPVRVSLHGTAAPGRVVSVDGDEATVDVEWVDEVESKKIPVAELLVLGDGAVFGDPIAYEDEGVTRHGELVHRSEPTSWVIAWGGQPKQVPTARIKPMDVTRIYAEGDQVMATFVGRFTPAKVTRVESNGVRYEVDRKEGGVETLSFTEITAPPW